MPTDTSYRPHLHRTGLALLIVGGIDIAAWLVCLVLDVPYVSSFNIFSVAGGIFLLRGSLRAASIVRRMAISMLALLAAVVLVSPLLQPPGLTLAMVKTHAALALLGGVLLVFTVALMAWLARELGAPPRCWQPQRLPASRCAARAGPLQWERASPCCWPVPAWPCSTPMRRPAPSPRPVPPMAMATATT